MIIVRTPLRISFFGGGTDLRDWLMRPAPGAVLSTTIDKYVYVQLRKLPALFQFNYRVAWGMLEEVNAVSQIQNPVVRAVLEHYGVNDRTGYEIIYNADLPSRSGLGSSSAFTVSMLNALMGDQGKLCSKRILASEAIRVERDLLKEAGGLQDQIATAYGGCNRIDFDSNGDFSVAPVRLSNARRSALESRLMLFFTGFTRSASDVEAAKTKNIGARQSELMRLYEIVGEGQTILEDESTPLDAFGRLLHETWTLKRTLAEGVSNCAVDEAYEAARAAGALGGKLLGAGGGGFLMMYVPPEKALSVRAAMSKLAHVPIKMDREGASVVLYAPELDDNYLRALACA
ncbi:MAG: kinase [Alphaproteobacteria bacterium]|nr:kinase [Alphaproteobacteria bacterium]